MLWHILTPVQRSLLQLFDTLDVRFLFVRTLNVVDIVLNIGT